MQRWLLLATASASMWRCQSRKTPVCLRLRRQSAALKKQYIIFLQLGPLSPLTTPSWLSLVWVHLCAVGLWLHSPLSVCVCVCGFCRLAGHVRETGVIVIYLSASDQPQNEREKEARPEAIPSFCFASKRWRNWRFLSRSVSEKRACSIDILINVLHNKTHVCTHTCLPVSLCTHSRVGGVPLSPCTHSSFGECHLVIR